MGYSIVTIKGEGPNSEYRRLADDTIRRSPLFWHLCRKIRKRASSEGINRKYRLKYMQTIRELEKEQDQFERYVNKLNRKNEHKIELLQKNLDKARKSRDLYFKRYNALKYFVGKTIEKKNILQKEVNVVKKNKRFFESELKISDAQSDKFRAELMLRAIFAYEELKKSNTITFQEVIILAVGTQIREFRLADIQKRFAQVTQVMHSINKMVELGLCAQTSKTHKVFYLTEAGKDRFKEIISVMYSKQYGHYWKGILTEEK